MCFARCVWVGGLCRGLGGQSEDGFQEREGARKREKKTEKLEREQGRKVEPK